MSSRSAEAATYEIRVRGRLADSWLDWLDGVAMAYEGRPADLGVTILTGSFDQAALRGLLTWLWDLNLSVLSVSRLKQRPA
jgi:hypothetical protein